MATPHKKVLLVVDQMDLKVFLSNLLASVGYKTTFAANRTEGLGKTMTEKPDLIIIDMMMPTDQGIKLYRTLKSDDNLSGLPVIMLSSIERRTFFQCHKIQKIPSAQSLPVPEAYIETPPEAEELLRMVQTLMSPARQRRSIPSRETV